MKNETDIENKDGSSEQTVPEVKVSRDSVSRENFKRIAPGKPRMKLTATNLPKGYVYYYAHPRQFQELLDAGYVFMKKDQHSELKLGSLQERPRSLGNLVSQEGGQSPEDRLYLMAINEEWHKENQKEKAAPVYKVENQIRKGKLPNAPETAYLPEGKENIID